MFNQLQIPQDQIVAEASRVSAQVSASMPGVLPSAHAAQVIAQRLIERPQAYIEFGPYWWAVKAALFAMGEDFGPEDDPLVLRAYGGALAPLEAFAAGELFKDLYRATYLAGTVQFWLDDEAQESYVLFDVNMEARRLGRPGLAGEVVGGIQAVAMADEPQ